MEESRLTVLYEDGVHTSPNGTKFKLVRVLCSCGTEKTVRVNDMKRRDRPTVSCGCHLREIQKSARPPVNHKHGRAARSSRDYLYHAWEAIKQRCYNPRDKYFHCYGGRGISLWNAWVNNPAGFCEEVLASIGARPAGMSLDRINNNRNYEPGNLRWATAKQQSDNRRPRSEWTPR